MKRIILLTSCLLFAVAAFAQTKDAPKDTAALKAKPVYGKEALVVSYILDNNHYRKIKLNDSLSSRILDAYIKGLDNNRTYFLASDIKAFEKYRNSIDDMTRKEDVSVAYSIYAVFAKRAKERLDYVLNDLIKRDFDYTTDEYYETERENEPWAKSTDELNDVWRKIIKSQALSLKLANKDKAEITSTLKTRYDRLAKTFSQFNSEDVFGIYMNAITEAYDPHTNYFSPRASDAFNQSMSLSLEGIGAQLQTDNDYTKIVNIIPGGPAEKSNKIHVNDLITGVGQGEKGEIVDIIGWRVDDVVKLIKGPKGTTVRLQFIPAAAGVGGPTQELTLVRDKIKLEQQAAKKSVINYQSNGKNMKLGVITLPSFYMDFEAYQKGETDYRSTTRDVRNLIVELQKEGIDGIVMDLRNNGGGSLEEAIQLTGLFIKNGPVVQVKSSNNQVVVYDDEDQKVLYGGPLVVLTNRFSASASEIFAGAIQDYQRGVIVGESTFGKGTVQKVLDLGRFIDSSEPVGELKITFQKFYRVAGSSTQHKGVTPDVKLPSALGPDQFGESSNPSALPWDVIKSTNFQKATDVNGKVIADLNKAYQERVKFDPSLKKYITETEELKNNLAQTRVSLNETKRKAEMEEQKKREASEKMDTKIGNKEGMPIDVLKLDDEYLREGALILSELVNKKIG
ncbi:MAG TPA: carboxy terminal-processing peptidase [Cyclobacteriaceae bacterium]|nr:carboxy terminal-processing peptidase [Cyclobacteriaceae bacterium]